MKIVILGLSMTSSWGNGHATTYRGLVRELESLGHRILFLERDVPWYAGNRDLPNPPYGRTCLYESLEDLKERFTGEVRAADAVVIGSYVPEGVSVGWWARKTARGVVAFYDIDTPVTLAKLERADFEYIDRELVQAYDLYLSFAGGKALRVLEERFGVSLVRPLYCSVDTKLYRPEADVSELWHLGYMGTYSADRQPPVEKLLVEPARRWPGGQFVVAGPQYPDGIVWPDNVARIDHLPPAEHCTFYNRQRFTLNITRADMVAMGHSPSVRLFEAAACGVPVISDWWEGLDEFFEVDSEILISRSPEDTLSFIRNLTAGDARAIGGRARERVLREHTARHRAAQLVTCLSEAASSNRGVSINVGHR